MSCGVVFRCGLGPTLLWLQCRPAAAAPIQPLAWESPCAVDAALKEKKKDYVCVYIHTMDLKKKSSSAINTNEM